MVVSRRGASLRAPRSHSESAGAARILVGDCVAEMSKLTAGSVDLVFADPPYNLQLQRDLKRPDDSRSEEHTSELQSPDTISYAVFCLKKKNTPSNDKATNKCVSRQAKTNT